MIDILKSIVKNEKGSVSIISAVCIVIFLAFAALVIDLGIVQAEKSSLQNAVDAAALAAANELPDTQKALETAREYMQKNGYLPSDISVTFSDSNRVINIVGQKQIEYLFAKAIGLDYATIVQEASAGGRDGGEGGIWEPFEYALFSGSRNDNLFLSGSSFEIYGSTHTNKDFNLYCSYSKITGVCSASGSIVAQGSSINISNRVSQAPIVEMPDFSEEIRQNAIANGTYYNGNKVFNGDNIVIDQDIYVNGDVTINSDRFTGTGFLYATGNITINTSTSYSNPGDSICIYSGKNVYINTNQITVYGTIYAPNGSINASLSSFYVYGRLIANKINIYCSTLKVTAGEEDLGFLPSSGNKASKLIK